MCFVIKQNYTLMGTLNKTITTIGRDHAITMRPNEKYLHPKFCFPTSIGLASRSFGATYEVILATGLISWIAHISWVGAMG